MKLLLGEPRIEHLTYDEGKFMMAEAYRVLAPSQIHVRRRDTGRSVKREPDSGAHEFEENISNNEHLRELEEWDADVYVRWSDYETMTIEVEKPRTATTRPGS